MTYRKIEIGMDVIGADGEKIGTVAGVVIDPRTGELRAGVLHTGHLPGDDFMVPRESMTGLTGDVVQVSFTRREVRAMTDEHATDFLNPPAGFYATSGVYWPPTNIYLADVGFEQGPESPLREAPGAYLSHGTLVVDKDGEPLGHIVEFAADERGHVAGFRVERGRFRHQERYIPAHFVAEATDERVTLSASLAELEALDVAPK
jgi:uncharacterized protein YrrD